MPSVQDPPPSPAAATGEDLDAGHRRVLEEATRELLSRRGDRGHWRGRLSESALSTAVASFALHYAGERRGEDPERDRLIRRGLDWLSRHANADGGWGDTVRSRSNLPTTTLCWAALSAGASDEVHHQARHRAGEWIAGRAGSLEPDVLKKAIEELYGEDKTFSVPILTFCALAGVLGGDEEAFRGAPALPFELAVLPQGLFRFVGLPVVSYALPALIAVGQAQHHRRPSRNPVLRALRRAARRPSLEKLSKIQPSSGGFLEAIPLTGFVALSLAGAGEADHGVVDLAFDFLTASVLGDGSWPIDIDLATWVTTLSIQALSEADGLESLGAEGRETIHAWLLGQQYREVHPFTGAAPGGWAWTDLPGGVPDADDTPGALLALRSLAEASEDGVTARDRGAAAAGVRWLLGLQNRDGGIPTFCRGWGKLPFDHSSPDLTAHTLRAFAAWRTDLPPDLGKPLRRATRSALAYLAREQQRDGAWVPLWFGHEAAPGQENRVYGTSKVLAALVDAAPLIRELGVDLDFDLGGDPAGMIEAAAGYLAKTQNADGGWGGAEGVASSFEETALAVDALARLEEKAAQDAVRQGVRYLVTAWDAGAWREATPIGFYFANLWYFEDLYPLTFGVAALGRALRRAPPP